MVQEVAVARVAAQRAANLALDEAGRRASGAPSVTT